MRTVFLTCVILAGIGLVGMSLVSTSVRVQSAPVAQVQTQKIQRQGVKQVPSSTPTKQGRDTTNPPIVVQSEPKVTRNDAELDALVQAQIELEKYLSKLDPPISWKPSLEFIRTRLVKDTVRVIETEIPNPKLRDTVRELEQRETLLQVEFTLEITPQVRRELLYFARLDRSETRLLAVLPMLAGLILALLAAATYINLDERTKGYYTGWLRFVAGGAIVAVLASGWWFFRHRIFE